MHRSLLAAAALCCLPACGDLPLDPGIAQPSITGRWSGTFQSSWGVLPVRASLSNERYSGSVTGEFQIDGQRASGTISGTLETKSMTTLFWGSLTISYVTASGETCKSESAFLSTSGHAAENGVSFSTEGFPKGTCPDPPTKVVMSLHR
jgi:hypothetical protein